MTKLSRARNPNAKLVKRRAILDSAEQLFLERRKLAAMADIAADVGVSKGLLYVYFKTKEDLYLTLLSERLSAWRAETAQVLAKAPDPLTCEAIAEAIVSPCDVDPALLPLSAAALAEAERGASSLAVADHKRLVADGTTQLAQRIAARAPVFDVETATIGIVRSFALLVGLNVVHDQGPTSSWVGRAVGAHLMADTLAEERRVAVAALWRGMSSAAGP